MRGKGDMILAFRMATAPASPWDIYDAAREQFNLAITDISGSGEPRMVGCAGEKYLCDIIVTEAAAQELKRFHAAGHPGIAGVYAPLPPRDPADNHIKSVLSASPRGKTL